MNSIRGRVVKKHKRREIRIKKKSLGISRASSNLVVCVKMEYFCNECGGKVNLNPSEPIICNFCGSRILYKPRTKKILQYEAK